MSSSSGSETPGSTQQRHRATRRRVEEPQEVLSGRMWIPIAMVAFMGFVPWWTALAQALEPKGPPDVNPNAWAVGQTVRVPITLVTADYGFLACASDQTFQAPDQDVFGPVRCEYKSNGERWPVEPTAPVEDSRANVIQPYSAYPNNDLVLVEGLWA